MRLRGAALAVGLTVLTIALGGCAPAATQAVPAAPVSQSPAAPTPQESAPASEPTATPSPALTRQPVMLTSFRATPTPTPKPTPSGEVTMDASANAAKAAAKAAEDKKKAQAASVAVGAQAATDARCGYGEVMCISKSSNTMHFMQDGKIVATVDVRFGKEDDPERRTREGNFLVFRKEVQHTSNLYGSEMPYAMFFSGGQAVHFSSDFAARGYNGNSHGCVNVRDKATLATIFDQVDVMSTRVVVY